MNVYVLTASVSYDLKRHIQKLAKEQGLSVSAYIRTVLAQHVAKMETGTEQEFADTLLMLMNMW